MLVMMTTSAGMTFVGGLLLRWTGHRRKPLLIGAVGLVLIALVLLLAGICWRAGGWLFLVACVLLAASTCSSPAALSSMKELNRPDAVAQAIAVSNCAAYLGVGAVAYLGGWVLDRYRGEAIATAGGIVYPPQAYATYFILLLGLALVALVACLRVRETRGESLYGETSRPEPDVPI
jgi:predicted MFS family arabinose efflux permease